MLAIVVGEYAKPYVTEYDSVDLVDLVLTEAIESVKENFMPYGIAAKKLDDETVKITFEYVHTSFFKALASLGFIDPDSIDGLFE